jgi:hypothetical protein
MSELPEPNPRTPSSAAPKTPTKSAAPTGSLNQIFAKVQPIAQQAWVSSRPTIAQALKATIGLLQSATDQLDRQIQTDKRPVKPLNLEPVKRAANTFWTKAQPIWAKLIGLIRSRLSTNIGGKLTDRALSGIIAGFALLLLAITTHLPSGGAAPKPQPMTKGRSETIVAARPAPVQRPTTPIAQRYPVDVAPGAQPTFPTALSAPGTPQAAATIAPTAITTPITPAPPTAIAALPTTPIAPTAPASIIPPTTIGSTGVGASPAVAERPFPSREANANAPTGDSAPQPTPITPAKPIVKLTANQKLLAKLQTATGDRPTLLQTIKPNKATKSLQIILNPEWYELPLTQQDTVAQDLFTKAQSLRFNTLELVNAAGDVVARSPVVGNEMVVLLRKIEN